MDLVFLPRHGRQHRLAPADINYRANVAALKLAGCDAILAFGACGSFTDDLSPGYFCLVDQFVDRTHGRHATFFDAGITAHVSFADPVSADLQERVARAATKAGVDHRVGGTYLAINGPRFQTRAESRLARTQGLDVVGMTAMPEAALAREAEMAYSLVAMVTDHDCWKDEAVTARSVLDVMARNIRAAQMLVGEVATILTADPLPTPSREGWKRALDEAILTPRSQWPVEASARLRAIAPRLFQ